MLIRVLTGIFMMFSISGILEVWGLSAELIFNKGIWSIGAFFLGAISWDWLVKHWREDRRTCLISYLMAYALMFTEVLGTAMRLEASQGGVSLNPVGILWLATAAIFAAIPAESLFFWLGSRITILGREKGAGNGHPFWQSDRKICRWSLNRWFLTFWAILFVGYLPCLLAFYPGLYCYDMIWQWAQFAAGDYSTHHPLLHTYFSGGVIELGKMLFGSYQKGLFLHSVVQLAILSGSLAYGLRFLVKRQIRPAVLGTVGAFFLFFPFFPIMGISTTKDTIFGGLFLIVFVSVCDMLVERQCYRGWKLAGFFSAAVLMCLFRNNAMYGLALMAVILGCVWIWQKWIRRDLGDRRPVSVMIVLLVLCVAASKGSFMLLEKGFHASKGSSAEMLSVPMQQMARAYVYHPEEFTQEEKDQLFSFFGEDNVLAYKYYVSDPVKSGMKMDYFQEHKGDFVRLWLQLAKKFPGEYLAAPLYNTFGLWYLGGDSSCYLEYQMSPLFDDVHVVETDSKLPGLQKYYQWFTDQNLQAYLPGLSIFFYTSFYSWCVAWSAGILLIRKRYSYLVLPLFVACYQVSLFFGPCIIIRYMLGAIFCVPVLLVMTFLTEAPDNAALSGSAGTRNPDGSLQ